MRRPIIIAVCLAALAGATGFLLLRTPAATADQTIGLATVERADLAASVAASGRVVAHLDVDIKCKASGTVTALPVDIGSVVKAGDLLLELDPVDEQRALDQSAAGVATAEARLAQAMQNLVISEADLLTSTARARANLLAAQSKAADAAAKAARLARLRLTDLATPEDADSATATAQQAAAEATVAATEVDAVGSLEKGLEVKRQEVVAAQAQVSSAKAALALAQRQVKDTTIRAPMAGTITVRNVQIGSIISSGITNVGGGTTVLTLSDLSRLTVLAAVDEADIAAVAVGQGVRIAADAFPDRTFGGTVVQVAVRGINASNVVTFEVKVEVEDADRGLLKPEMTAQVEITTGRSEKALCVPVAALTRKDAGWTVQVALPDGSARTQAVTIGISDGQRSEVRSGLAEGDQVRLRSSAPASTWQKPQMGTPPGGMP